MKLLDKIPFSATCPCGQVRHELSDTLRLQRLLAEISSRFVTRPPEQVDDTIEETQRLICETLGLDRSTLWQATADGTGMALTHFWQKPGCVPLRRNFVAGGNLPWAEGALQRGESFHFASLGDLPPEAVRDVETLRLHGTKSNATFPLFADGRVFGALAFAMTTVEREWTEDELAGLALVAQIFGHVISRRRAEARAEQLREEIQRSARASVLGELAAGLAHEINQPLTTILGNAQAARRFIHQGTAEPAEILAILDDIIRDDKRAGEVIRNLRQMLTGSPTLHQASCLNELVSEVCGFLRPGLAKEGVKLQLDLTSSPLRIKAERTEIRQVLLNLILNAGHAMSKTPPEQRRILIQTCACGPWADVRVRDHGCGIPPAHLDRIFEPFHTTRASGLGMGLAICRRIAEAHGGSICASNHETGGAVFLLSLPHHA